MIAEEQHREHHGVDGLHGEEKTSLGLHSACALHNSVRHWWLPRVGWLTRKLLQVMKACFWEAARMYSNGEREAVL